MRGFQIALSSLALLACTQLPLVTPPKQSDFDRSLYHARRNVDAGNYWAADRLLDEFVRTHPDTREAREIAFWKAAYMVDPANDRGSLAGGIAALDAYLADSAGWYKNEAIVLRRTALVAQRVSPTAVGGSSGTSTTASGSTSPTGTTDTVVVVSRSRDEEIASLREQLAKSKEELAKVSDELERIKKRLANPSN
jgi:hypothetical protein